MLSILVTSHLVRWGLGPQDSSHIHWWEHLFVSAAVSSPAAFQSSMSKSLQQLFDTECFKQNFKTLLCHRAFHQWLMFFFS